MIAKILKFTRAFIKEVDIFGANYQPYISENRKECKSFFSGFMTIIIYTLTFIYFVYLMDLWRKNQIQPKVTEINQLQEDQVDFFFETSPITIDLLARNTSFLEGKRIYDVLVTTFGQKGEQFSYEQAQNVSCMQPNTERSQIGLTCLDIQQSDSKLFQQSSFNKIVIYFYKCNKSKHNNCISDEDLQYVYQMKESIFIRVTQWIEQYDYINNLIKTVPQIDYIPFKIEQTQLMAYDANLVEASFDNGILLENLKNIRYVKNYRNYQYQYNINETWRNFIPEQCYLQIQLGLNSEYSILTIQNIKISEIIAQISSIFEILMLLEILCKFYNEEKLSFKISKKLLKINPLYDQDFLIQNFKSKFLNIFKQKSSKISQREKNQIKYLLKQQNIFYQLQQLHLIQNQLKINPFKLLKQESKLDETKVYPLEYINKTNDESLQIQQVNPNLQIIYEAVPQVNLE